MHVSPEFAVSFAWRFLHRLRGAVHSLGVALVLFMTLGCVDAKLSLAEEENGAEIVAVLMHMPGPCRLFIGNLANLLRRRAVMPT